MSAGYVLSLISSFYIFDDIVRIDVFFCGLFCLKFEVNKEFKCNILWCDALLGVTIFHSAVTHCVLEIFKF